MYGKQFSSLSTYPTYVSGLGGLKVTTCMALWPLELLPCIRAIISPKVLELQCLIGLWRWQDSIYRHTGVGSIFVIIGR